MYSDNIYTIIVLSNISVDLLSIISYFGVGESFL